MGLRDVEIAEAFASRARPEEEHACEIWPENWPALEAFLSLSTQWRASPRTGAALGLDYAAAESVMRLLEVKDRRAVFEDLRVMERAALRVFSGQEQPDEAG